MTPNVSGKDFGNYKNATVVVDKVTIPADDPQEFSFTDDLPGDPSRSPTTTRPIAVGQARHLHGDRGRRDRLDLTGLGCPDSTGTRPAHQPGHPDGDHQGPVR